LEVKKDKTMLREFNRDVDDFIQGVN